MLVRLIASALVGYGSAALAQPVVPAIVQAGVIEVGSEVRSLALTPDGRSVVISMARSGSETGNQSGRIEQRDLASGGISRVFRTQANSYGVAISADGATLIAVTGGFAAGAWAMADGRALVDIKMSSSRGFGNAAFNPVTGMLAISERSFATPTTTIWRLEPREELFHVPGGPSAVFSEDGSRLLVGSGAGQAFLYDAATGSRIAALDAGGVTVQAVAFDPSGRAVATSVDGAVLLWDVKARSVARRLPTGESAARSLDYSADGSFLAAGLDDGTVLLWSRGVDDPVRLDGHSGRVSAVAFTADGTRLLSGSEDGTVRFWGDPAAAAFLAPAAFLYVSGAPAGATLSLDGGPATPVPAGGLEVPGFPGTAEVVVRAPGFDDLTLTTELTPGTTRSLDVAMKRMVGALSISSDPPGASVEVAGRAVGTAPVVIRDLAPGPVAVTLRLADHRELKLTGNVKGNTTTDLPGRLQELPGLKVDTIPTGATVKVAGRVIGTTPLVARNLTPGRTEFALSLNGYQTFTGRATVPQAGKGLVNVILNPVGTRAGPPAPAVVSSPTDPKLLGRARDGLALLDGHPALPATLAAGLVGARLFGDESRLVFALSDLEVALEEDVELSGLPAPSRWNGELLVPLAGLRPLGVAVSTNAEGVVVRSGGRLIDLGKPRARYVSERVWKASAARWAPAFAGLASLDGAPAFPLGKVLPLLKGVSWDAKNGKLYTNGKLVARLWAAVGGLAETVLIVYEDRTYLRADLLPRLGVRAGIEGGHLTVWDGDAQLWMPWPGATTYLSSRELMAAHKARVETARREARAKLERELRAAEATRKAEADRQRAIALERGSVQLRLSALKRAFLRDFVHLGGNYFGRSENRSTADGDAVATAIVLATSTNRSTWKVCTQVTAAPSYVRGAPYGRNGELHVPVVVQGLYGVAAYRYEPTVCAARVASPY